MDTLIILSTVMFTIQIALNYINIMVTSINITIINLILNTKLILNNTIIVIINTKVNQIIIITILIIQRNDITNGVKRIMNTN